jgi:hypothetical protein
MGSMVKVKMVGRSDGKPLRGWIVGPPLLSRQYIFEPNAIVSVTPEDGAILTGSDPMLGGRQFRTSAQLELKTMEAPAPAPAPEPVPVPPPITSPAKDWLSGDKGEPDKVTR